jgi:Zn-dependent peptidase ImmA (M78 family)/transcriptional regulator with XRE-family HTH domain
VISGIAKVFGGHLTIYSVDFRYSRKEDASLIGERLKAARAQRGWTLEALSKQTDIPVSSLSEFETGRREPRLTHLETLARAHGKAVSWFFDPVEPVAEVVLWRERPQPEEAAAVEGEFLKLCRWYRNLEEWCDEHRPCLLPDVRASRDAFDWSDVQQLANAVRNHLNLGQRPASSLLNVLENTWGVRVFHLEFNPTGTAACTRDEELGMAILLNANNKRWRRNFDLAHELFHLLTWRIFRTESTAREASEKEEKFADKFASCLLIPEDALRAMIAAASKSRQSLKHIELFDIARQFDVSIDALLWRVHWVFNRSMEDTQRDLGICRAFRETVDVREDTKPPSLPERYRALALRAIREGELSIGRAAEYLGLSRKEAMALDDVEDVTDDAISLSPA